MAGTHHLHWGAEALWEQLQPLLPGVSVEVVARIDSTNTRLIERARQLAGARDAPISRPGRPDFADSLGADAARYGRRAGDTEPCLLVAEHQTRGRGRLGRDWQASAGASLTFSLSLALAPQDWSGLSLAVGVALADALEPAADAPSRIGLKWPNDLWHVDGPGRGRKLGGVLIETVAVSPTRRMCVVGVGLNVLPQPTRDLAHGFACLSELDDRWTAPAALAAVAAPLVTALLRFEREGFAPFVDAYARRDLLRGQRVSTSAPDAPEGTAEGVDAQGALLVRGAGLQRIVSGEVTVRLQPGAPGAA